MIMVLGLLLRFLIEAAFAIPSIYPCLACQWPPSDLNTTRQPVYSSHVRHVD